METYFLVLSKVSFGDLIHSTGWPSFAVGGLPIFLFEEGEEFSIDYDPSFNGVFIKPKGQEVIILIPIAESEIIIALTQGKIKQINAPIGDASLVKGLWDLD